MNYLIDFFLMASRLAPVNKRLSIHLAWLNCYVTPMKTLNDAFFGVFFIAVKNRAKRTGQKIILEQTLNDVFNPEGVSRITIDNAGDNLETSFFYNSNEGYPGQTLYNETEGEEPFYFYNEEEYFELTGFTVYVPLFVLSQYTVNQIRAEVDKYRPAGTTFKIKTY